MPPYLCYDRHYKLLIASAESPVAFTIISIGMPSNVKFFAISILRSAFPSILAVSITPFKSR